ncbi:MAG: ion transporter [Planctomycetota bacterium]
MSDAPATTPLRAGPAAWQRRWFTVIFGHETPAGRAFDLALLAAIVLSVLAVMLESAAPAASRWRGVLDLVEWAITTLFTLEFLARLACVDRPWRYASSFFGIVDIISLLPSYLGLYYRGADSLATIRTLRLLRVFRLLKLARHVREAQGLLTALRRTWPKITVFLSVVVCTIVILGTVMYLVEGDAGSGFDSIPAGVYWAIVTMTTVGFGDITPVTPLGKTIAAMVMLLGYAIIIVPTGLFSAQMINQGAVDTLLPRREVAGGESAGSESGGRSCSACGAAGLAAVAVYCHTCGCRLSEATDN